MPLTFAQLFQRVPSAYVFKVDFFLIDYTTEAELEDFIGKPNVILQSQPACNTIFRYASDDTDCFFDFNPNMPVSFKNTGFVTVADIYGNERKIILAKNITLNQSDFE